MSFRCICYLLLQFEPHLIHLRQCQTGADPELMCEGLTVGPSEARFYARGKELKSTELKRGAVQTNWFCTTPLLTLAQGRMGFVLCALPHSPSPLNPGWNISKGSSSLPHSTPPPSTSARGLIRICSMKCVWATRRDSLKLTGILAHIVYVVFTSPSENNGMFY